MNSDNIIQELKFKAVRSSGAGGQHVNKVSSKVELLFDLQNSLCLSDDEKELLIQKLKSKFTKENVLLLSCDESRSQHKNKEIVTKRFLELIKKGLKVPKKRKATKPSKSSIQKRLDKKKKHAYKKAFRRKPKL
ncbi:MULTISPECIES: alternative ribosome rescue aminoacyl-tRNA hydrolase ArfB [Flavobacteriaceae]|uniref:Aminoacyl-tRNA hydrolase n=2 Tax=Flavobacteriaceae TaxID=49546 RepID=A0A4Y8AR65_9FLAO|nr:MULTISPECIES: alternative ribosome rescue aminoacyl-tRNA hydrolase ArfB [Flavobacteriaceae]TEW72867.1 aminoacyl-tRNA hydrolase [Gramella jeungdoensis]GGK49017.1 aminoacyl-tRNA hydrolase [Lutibacter litoralis]